MKAKEPIIEHISGSTCFLLKELLEEYLASDGAKTVTFDPMDKESINYAHDRINEMESALDALRIFTMATEGECPIVKLNNSDL